MIGKTFGKLTVVSTAGMKGKCRAWECECECGKFTVLRTSSLSRTKSCGCLLGQHKKLCLYRDLARDQAKKHGMTKTPTYRTWCEMIQRCTNPKREKYARYGGRGITVCERWASSFESFMEDMGKRPLGMTLDRFPNRDGNYEKTNCRWATSREQADNRSATKLNPDLINEIRRRFEHGESQTSIARRFSVTAGHVNNIIARRTWSHVP